MQLKLFYFIKKKSFLQISFRIEWQKFADVLRVK